MKEKFKTIKELEKNWEKLSKKCVDIGYKAKHFTHCKADVEFARFEQAEQICEMIEEKMNEYNKYYLKAHDKKEKHQEDIFYSTYSEFKEILSKIRGADGEQNV